MAKAYQKNLTSLFILLKYKRFHYKTPNPTTFRTLAVICFRFYFTSVQNGVYSLGKAHMRSIPSLRRFPNVPFETVSMFVWLTMALSCRFKEDRRALPLFMPRFLLNIFVNARGEKMDPRRQFLWNVKLNICWKFIFRIVLISHWNGGLFQGESSAAAALASLNYPSVWGKGYTIRQRLYCSLGIVNVCKQIIHAIQRSGSSPR